MTMMMIVMMMMMKPASSPRWTPHCFKTSRQSQHCQLCDVAYTPKLYQDICPFYSFKISFIFLSRPKIYPFILNRETGFVGVKCFFRDSMDDQNNGDQRIRVSGRQRRALVTIKLIE